MYRQEHPPGLEYVHMQKHWEAMSDEALAAAALQAEDRAFTVLVARLLPRVRDIRRAGTAALDLSAAACGRVNAFYERTLNPWDLAAGALIAEEAGAVVKGLGVDRPSRDFLITGHPDVVGPLEELLVAGRGVTVVRNPDAAKK